MMAGVAENPVLWKLLAAVWALNLPFGYWRSGVPSYSRSWFWAVHLPVPVVMTLRLCSGVGSRPATFALLAAAFFCGQLAGGLLRRGSQGVRRGR